MEADNGKKKPTFGLVFSITWKVVLALSVISLITGLVYGLFSTITKSADTIGSTGTTSTMNDDAKWRWQMADDAPTKMPKSKWDKEVHERINEHTLMEGMTKDEVKQALGVDEPWVYTLMIKKGTEQPCERYEGEECVKYPPDEVERYTLKFTPSGHYIADISTDRLRTFGRTSDPKRRATKTFSG